MGTVKKLEESPQKKSKGGRPTNYDPDYHPQSFIKLSRKGKNLTQIAFIWKQSRSNLYEWESKYPEFSDAIKKGRFFCEGWWLNKGQEAVFGQTKYKKKPTQFNLGAYVWLTKNMFKWSDRIESNDKLDLTERPLKDVSDEELESYDV